jgi:hypothetical protein
MMGRGLYAKLAPWMIAEADFQAKRRRDYAKSIGRIPGNNLVADEEEALAMDILGCRCERAGKVILPTLVWHTELVRDVDSVPDLGDFVDVKGMKLDRHHLLIPRAKLKLQWAYLLISAEEHPYYWCAGWLWGHEVPAIATAGPYAHRPSYQIEAEQMHKPYLLQQFVKERSQHVNHEQGRDADQ